MILGDGAFTVVQGGRPSIWLGWRRLVRAPNAIDAAGVFIDVDSEGDGVTVSVLVT